MSTKCHGCGVMAASTGPQAEDTDALEAGDAGTRPSRVHTQAAKLEEVAISPGRRVLVDAGGACVDTLVEEKEDDWRLFDELA